MSRVLLAVVVAVALLVVVEAAFKHPGVLVDRKTLNFVKSKIIVPLCLLLTSCFPIASHPFQYVFVPMLPFMLMLTLGGVTRRQRSRGILPSTWPWRASMVT